MQERKSSGHAVTETTEIKITIKKTVTETDTSKETACSCSPKCKR